MLKIQDSGWDSVDHGTVLEVDIAAAGVYYPSGSFDTIDEAMLSASDLQIGEGDFTLAGKITLTSQGKAIRGRNGNFLHQKTQFLLPPALADYAIQSAITRGCLTLSDFKIDGTGADSCLGGIYLKDDGGSLNTSNRIENIEIREFSANAAVAYKIEAWATTLRNIFAGNIFRGYGIFFGAGGVTGTTQFIERAYLSACDVCINVSGTTLGVTFINPIMESSPVCYYQYSNDVTMINPYFENVNTLNVDGMNRRSLNLQKIQNNTGDYVDYAVYIDGLAAKLTMLGGHITSLNDAAASKFLGVGSSAFASLQDVRFPSNFDERHIFEIGSGRIEIINPKGLNIEAVKDSVSLIRWGNGTDSYDIQNGVVKTTGPANVNTLSRKMGDIHTLSVVGADGVMSNTVVFSASTVTTSAIAAAGTVFTVASAAQFRAGDYVCIRQDDRSYHYTTIASIATNTITLTLGIVSATASGNSIKVWRWSPFESLTNEKYTATVAAAATEEILTGVWISITTVKCALVVITQANTIVGIYRVWMENRAGTIFAITVVTEYETIATPTFAGSYSANIATLSVTNNAASAMSVSAKVVDSMFIF